MALAKADIQFTKDHLGDWLAEQSLGKPPAACEIELRERMVRVAEGLRHQGELIKTILVQMDKRFEELTRHIDRFMFRSFGLSLSVGALIVAPLKL